MLTGIIPGTLKYVEGDATLPSGGGHRMLIHIVNDSGELTGEFADSITKRWPSVKSNYRLWYRSQRNFKQGQIQSINIQSDLTVISMLTQTKCEHEESIVLDHLKNCLNQIAVMAKEFGSSVHISDTDIKSDRSDELKSVIIKSLIEKGINVYIYCRLIDA